LHAAPVDSVALIVDPNERYPRYTVNPELWIRPVPGTGIVAGQVCDAQGRPVPQARGYGLMKAEPQETPVSDAETGGERNPAGPAGPAGPPFPLPRPFGRRPDSPSPFGSERPRWLRRARRLRRSPRRRTRGAHGRDPLHRDQRPARGGRAPGAQSARVRDDDS